MLSFKVKINNDWINFTSVYAPPEEDNPDFFLKTKGELDTMEGDLGILCGDFNTTLDPKNDRYGYVTDNHKKCRHTINSWIETKELVGVVRHFHPDTPLYSWRTKDLGKKGRIDHLLATPKLLPFIRDARYVYHEHSLTDPASLIFTMDIEKQI